MYRKNGLTCLISDIRVERHKTFWEEMINMFTNFHRMSVKSLHIPQLFLSLGIQTKCI